MLNRNPYAGRTPYDVLRVDRDADVTAVKRAYIQRSKECKRGSEEWQEVQTSKQALTDCKRRLLIDLYCFEEKREYMMLVEKYGHSTFELSLGDDDDLRTRLTELDGKRDVSQDYQAIDLGKTTVRKMEQFRGQRVDAFEVVFET